MERENTVHWMVKLGIMQVCNIVLGINLVYIRTSGFAKSEFQRYTIPFMLILGAFCGILWLLASLMRGVEKRNFKVSALCFVIYWGALFLQIVLAEEVDADSYEIFFAGTFFAGAAVGFWKGWRFLHMLEQEYPWMYKKYQDYAFERSERNFYLECAREEILETTPREEIRRIAEDSKALLPILALHFEGVALTTLVIAVLGWLK